MAAQALGITNIDVVVLQETEFMVAVFVACSFEGYSILAAAADSDERGEDGFVGQRE